MGARALDPELDGLRMCLGCSYALGGLGAAERCPECGAACDAGTIALPMASLDLRGLVIVSAVVIALFVAIAVWIVGWGSGWRAGPVAVVALVGGASVVGVWALARRWRRGSRAGGMVAFTDEGVRERVVGVWTGTMPYTELARVEVVPMRGWRAREHRWKVRIDVEFAKIPVAYVRGTVVLTEAQARALGEELGRRRQGRPQATTVGS